MELIASQNNAKIKLVRSLAEKKFRDEYGLFYAEGANILKDVAGKIQPKYVFVSADREDLFSLAERLGGERFSVNGELFAKISDTKTPQGILAVFEKFGVGAHSVNESVFAVLDGISDAGNVGTIVRTCAALGVTELYFINCADAFGPKAVRASMGGIFRINFHIADYKTLETELHGRPVYALDMKGENIYDFTPQSKFAVAVGSEAKGVSEELKKLAKSTLSLPMTGEMESLNAAVSMSVALYELIFGVK